MIRDSATTFEVEGAEAGGGRIQLNGLVDENADLSFFGALRGSTTISLKGVRRINSFGVRAWIDGIRKIPRAAAIEFIECSPPVIDQVNMVAGFLGHGKVVSFYAPMFCERCDLEEDRLFQVADCLKNGARLPEVTCGRCGKPMEMDEVEEQYLLFLREG